MKKAMPIVSIIAVRRTFHSGRPSVMPYADDLEDFWRGEAPEDFDNLAHQVRDREEA
jgi:hypothetical protein